MTLRTGKSLKVPDKIEKTLRKLPTIDKLHLREVQREKLRSFMRNGRNEHPPSKRLKATGKRIRLTISQLFEAYRPETLVAWRSFFVPPEILYATGLQVMCYVYPAADWNN